MRIAFLVSLLCICVCGPVDLWHLGPQTEIETLFLVLDQLKGEPKDAVEGERRGTVLSIWVPLYRTDSPGFLLHSVPPSGSSKDFLPLPFPCGTQGHKIYPHGSTQTPGDLVGHHLTLETDSCARCRLGSKDWHSHPVCSAEQSSLARGCS